MNRSEQETIGQTECFLIDQAVRELYPGAAWNIRPLFGGYRAQTFHVIWNTRGSTGGFVAKISRDVDGLRREDWVLRTFLPLVGLPSPVVFGLFEGDGSVLSAREYMDGDPLTRLTEPDFGPVMEQLARLHSFPANADNRGEPYADLWDYRPQVLNNMFTRLYEELERAARHPLRPEWLSHGFIGRVSRVAAQAPEIMRPVYGTAACFVHGDAVPGNVLYQPEQHRYLFIDWEQFGLFLPHLDVLSVLYHHDRDDRQPHIARYLGFYRDLTGNEPGREAFLYTMDLVDLQRSAEIIAIWLAKVLDGSVSWSDVGGFLERRARAFEDVCVRYGYGHHVPRDV